MAFGPRFFWFEIQKTYIRSKLMCETFEKKLRTSHPTLSQAESIQHEASGCAMVGTEAPLFPRSRTCTPYNGTSNNILLTPKDQTALNHCHAVEPFISWELKEASNSRSLLLMRCDVPVGIVPNRSLCDRRLVHRPGQCKSWSLKKIYKRVSELVLPQQKLFWRCRIIRTGTGWRWERR